MVKHVDVIIVGAGVSGIGVAARMKQETPQKSFVIFERRKAIGGTWDLFRYPGIRSDSDMSTFGYDFKPWTASKVLASGEEIRNYVTEAAQEYKVTEHIRFEHQVQLANWNSKTQLWELEVLNAATGQTESWTANFVIGCTGYYNYDQGFRPSFPDEEKFKGDIIHPQHWPENFDYTGKRVVIIGSGATAITLVPSMSDKAAHVTMLQRSPTYIAAIPSIDFAYDAMKKVMPEKLAYSLTRGRNIGMQRMIFKLSQEHPKAMRKFFLNAIKLQVGDKVDMKHFTPHYNPWDQRLCVVPDGDLFKVLKKGKASVETDHIERFTETGIQLKSGKHLDADVIVTATGLAVQILGGIKATMDGKPLATSEHMLYRGILLSDVPNVAIIVGYINASWTLKVDVAAKYLTRLFKFMDQNKLKVVTPKGDATQMLDSTVMGDLSAGYIARAAKELPKQGKAAPWKVSMNYLADRVELAKSSFEDDVLSFDGAAPKAKKKRFKVFG